ncbi:MAG: DUF1460 domain-containing protein [Muribaculum sp.]|nr:DUF1460 domain-containing protein [Muribaculaceae bacterium]MCM1081726.1 DUF1460 domain-containing protein [Muribaculum sp.]
MNTVLSHIFRRLAYGFTLSVPALFLPVQLFAAGNDEPFFNNEAVDTIALNRILTEGMANVGHSTGCERIIFFGEQFLGNPYKSNTLEQQPERLVVNIDEFDCTTFVENLLAMAYTIGEGRTSWRDFVYNLQRFRYKNGEIDGYASRLHYISEFIVNNSHRGNLKEVTAQLPGSEYEVKTLDFMTQNRDSYSALADSAEYAKMRAIENGYRGHRYPYIRSSRVATKSLWKELNDGDIVCITAKAKGLDVQHMGVIKKVDGVPHLLHASSTEKKVVIDRLPLHEYLKKNRSAQGIRILRLTE